jgi:hypothetical protein
MPAEASAPTAAEAGPAPEVPAQSRREAPSRSDTKT